MKISQIRVSNFRCFGPDPVRIDLSDMTCLVGTNGSGKSAVLVAISKLFGVSEAERSVLKSDFHVPEGAEEEEVNERSLAIEVRVEFPELRDEENGSSGAIPECFNQMIVEEVGRAPYCRIRLEAKWVATNVSEGDIEQTTYWITTDGEEIDDHKRKMSAQERSLIHAIYVPAARDPQKQLRSARGSAFARLMRAVKWSVALRSTVRESADEILGAFDKEAAVQSVTRAIRRNWNELQSLAPFENPTLRPLNPEFESLIRNLELVFSPSNERTEEQVSRLSEGLQSLFYLAIVGMMFDIEEELLTKASEKSENGVAGDEHEGEEEDDEGEGIILDRLNPPSLVILGIEEPENHLAPHYLGRIMERLSRLGASQRGQVLLTSHSPSIMSRVQPPDVRYLRLNSRQEASLRKVLLPAASDEAFKYVNEAVRAYPELYFSTLVVLGEGDSEGVVLPRVAGALGVPLDRNFVSFVPLGGRHVHHFWRLLSDLEIPFVTLLDLDVGRESGGWARIKYACNELLQIGVKRKELLEVEDEAGKKSVVSDEDLKKMHTWRIDKKEDVELLEAWTECLERFDVFFSKPLDLDFSMLCKFPEAYQKTVGEGKGPTIPKSRAEGYEEELEQVRRSVLRSGSTGLVAYSASDKETFFWYRYLFLSRGKPSTHFQALSNMSQEALAAHAPKVLVRLVNRMKKKLNAHE